MSIREPGNLLKHSSDIEKEMIRIDNWKRSLRGVTVRLVQTFANKDLFLNLENKKECESKEIYIP